MGILNVTPDSFSDGGRFQTSEQLAQAAVAMVAAGADLIDIGGETTRPGSSPVPEAEQIRRVLPAIEACLNASEGIALSIDTTRAAVARAALDAGASIINDISGGTDDPAMIPLAADRRAPIILMHMQGTPATMQLDPQYADVTAEVKQYLADRCRSAEAAGVLPHRILIDPGIGFGKTQEHNLVLMRRLSEIADVGKPMVVGASRKGFIGKITGVTVPADRVFGTAATVAWSIANGAGIVRVHDVGPMSQVVRMVRAIQSGEGARAD